jgi:hypothetical protein
VLNVKQQKYVTAGVCDKISPLTQMMIWQLASTVPCQADYLQVFRLNPGVKNGRAVQIVRQSQEVPEFQRSLSFYCEEAVTAKLFMIDDGDHITLLLASEY